MPKLNPDTPPGFAGLYEPIVILTDVSCEVHLNAEYRDLCRKMLAALCFEGTPLIKGRPTSWAAGIMHAAGWVNFLQDPEFEPYLSTTELAIRLSVSQSTMMSKSKVVRETLELCQFHPDWTLPSLMQHNPLAWLVEVDGLAVDARDLPVELQDELKAAGIIPDVDVAVVTDRQVEADRADRGDIIGRIGPSGVQRR